jgi:SAM-dependent methyltransferase
MATKAHLSEMLHSNAFATEDRMDGLAQFKEIQKQSWVNFTPFEALTTPAAARLVKHAAIVPGMRVLDVACGTGVVAITAARLGAVVTALDLTPQLLERARENGRLANVRVDFHEGDVEHLPFPDNQFDAVLSQFGHIFAPRPEVAIAEMLRVLKPGGTLAFSSWPPEFLVGQTGGLATKYAPPPPAGVAPPMLWGDPKVIEQRLGSVVEKVQFQRCTMLVPALSLAHFRTNVERAAGPVIRLIEMLSATDPARLASFRQEFDAIVAPYFKDNLVRQDYLMTAGRKVAKV